MSDAFVSARLQELRSFLYGHGIDLHTASAEDLDTSKRAIWAREELAFEEPHLRLFGYALGELLAARYHSRWRHHDDQPAPSLQIKAGDRALAVDVHRLADEALRRSGASFRDSFDAACASLEASGAECIDPPDHS